ncbi:MAG: hypothetical protein CVU41_17400 [Chloroflexi bacterium HGW-Chloroflexi-3]|nr:MAG: hypothetical protein CVU41_17400 [Chloroflexi bacterium HGW-Chloroflexi-3]
MHKVIIFIQKKLSILITIGLVLAAILSITRIIHATNYGPWVFSDATTYIWTAINLADGKGLVIQNPSGSYDVLTWHPPLFSLLLSIPIAVGANALQSVRWINAFSFGITIFLGGFGTWRYTRSFLATLSVTALTVFAIDLIYVFSGAMSEAIFFVLGFGALILLVEAIQFNVKASLMIMAGILAGLSYLARYTGLAFVSVVVLLPMLFLSGSFRQRLRTMLLTGIPAVIIPAAWSVFVYLNNGTIGGRSMLAGENIRLNLTDYIQNFWDVMTGWIPFILRGNHILPAEWKFGLGVLIVMVVLVIGWQSYRKKSSHSAQRVHIIWLSTIGLFLAAYLGFHILSYIFSSAAPEVDRRLLSPLLLSVIILLGAIFSLPRQISIKGFRPFEWLFLIYAIISILYFHGSLRLFLYDQHYYGMGYTSKRWEDSELVRKAIQLDTSTLMASNNEEILFFHSGRFPYALDLPQAARGEMTLPADEAYLVLFRQDVVYFYGEDGKDYLQSVRQYCDVFFEDNEGYICYWER